MNKYTELSLVEESGIWMPRKLDELGSLNRGKSKHRPRNDPSLFGGQYPFIQTGDVKSSNFFIKDYSYTYNEVGLTQSKLWDKGTLCITIAANIAESGILAIDACFPDSIVGFVPDNNKCDIRFIKYWVDSFKLRMQSISSGTTQDNLSLDKLRTFDIFTPPLSTQQKIASILTAYDDLIENNNRRIQILEEMAQRIYREWFVHFRFPGHENVKMVDSELGKIPEGWEVHSLSDLFTYQPGSQPPKSTHIYEPLNGYTRFIQNRDYSGSESHITYIPDSHKNRICNKYDIMIDKYGDVGRIRFGLDGAYNVALAKLSPIKENSREYLRGYLAQSNVKKYLENASVASTRGSLNNTHFNFSAIVPDSSLLKSWESSSKNSINRQLLLIQQNQALRKTRDLLLPRLISGRLDVEDLDKT